MFQAVFTSSDHQLVISNLTLFSRIS